MVRWVRLIPSVLAVLVLSGAGLSLATPARAADDAVAVHFSPGSVAIPAGGSRTVVLMITNPTTSVMVAPKVELFADAGITAKDQSEAIGEIASGQTAAVKILITSGDQAQSVSTVQAVVTWSQAVGDPPLPGRAGVASLDVTALTDAGSVAITATTGSATLLEYQSTDVFFVIKNERATFVRVESATLHYPTFLNVTSVGDDDAGWIVTAIEGGLSFTPRAHTVLGPGDANVVHVRVKAGALQPGTAVLVLSAAVADNVTQLRGTVVGSQSMTFSVLGEEGILKALAVPNLVLLPGLVFIVVLWALRRYIVPGSSTGAPKLVGDDAAAMWVGALPIALSCAWLYPLVTSWLGERRDYKSVYGLVDVLYLWMLAAVLATLVWAVYVLCRWKYLPLPGQDARQLLRRFTFRPWKRGLAFDTVESTKPELAHQLLLVLRREGERLLVCAVIVGEVAENDEQTRIELATSALKVLRVTKGHRLDFEPGNVGAGAIRSPQWIASADVGPVTDEAPLVRLERTTAPGENLANGSSTTDTRT